MYLTVLQESHAETVVVAAVAQEVFRGLYLLLYRKAEEGMASMTEPGEPLPLNDLSSAVAAGLGFGTMGSVVMYGSLLATSVEEAVLYSDTCSEMSLFALSGTHRAPRFRATACRPHLPTWFEHPPCAFSQHCHHCCSRRSMSCSLWSCSTRSVASLGCAALASLGCTSWRPSP